MNDFLMISGWIFGLISMIIAVFQFTEKEKYKNKINNMEQVNKGHSTGYQSGGNMKVNNK